MLGLLLRLSHRYFLLNKGNSARARAKPELQNHFLALNCTKKSGAGVRLT